MAKKDTAQTPAATVRRAHCWHALRQLLCHPPVDVLQCCHCGGKATRRHVPEPGHGPHANAIIIPGPVVGDEGVDVEECRP